MALFKHVFLALAAAMCAVSVLAKDFKLECREQVVQVDFLNEMTFPMSFDIQSTNQHCIDSNAPEDDPECTDLRYEVSLRFYDGALNMHCSSLACKVKAHDTEEFLIPLSHSAITLAFYGDKGVSVIGSEGEQMLSSTDWLDVNNTRTYFHYNPGLDSSKFNIKYDKFFIRLSCAEGPE